MNGTLIENLEKIKMERCNHQEQTSQCDVQAYVTPRMIETPRDPQT